MEEDISLGGPAGADNPNNAGSGVSLGSDAPALDAAASSGDEWGEALSEENRTLVKNKGWQGPDDALKSYRELDEYRGRSVALPGDQATDDDWKSFRQKLGMPQAADAYEFTTDEGLDDAGLTSLKGLFHSAELDQRQAKALYRGLSQTFDDAQQAADDAEAKQLTEAKEHARAALTEAWGKEGGETFKRNTEMARRAVDVLGGNGLFEELRQLGAISDDNQILSPVLAKALADAGNLLFAEDGLIEGGDGLAVNPFADATLNLTAQGQLVQSDPTRARMLIQAANKRPENYGLSSNSHL